MPNADMTQDSEAWVVRVPAFVDELAAQVRGPADDTAWIRLAIALSRENVLRGHSPFGAVVTAGGHLVAAGVNCVLTTGLSIAHAEIVAIMRAQQALQCGVQPAGPLTLYTSTEPCCQCFGAVFWSGVTRLVCAARTADAEAIGFHEGPKPAHWPGELESRGISVSLTQEREAAREVLLEYQRRGGPIYGSRPPSGLQQSAASDPDSE